MDINESLGLRGIAAVLIVLHHVQQQGYAPKIAFIMGYIGFITVALFFFLSGYGLMFGYKNKEKYLDHFLVKHLLNIYIPYWIVILLETVMNYLTTKQFSLSKLGIELLGYSDNWFVTAILIFYICFYVSFSGFDSMKYKYLCLTALLLVYIVVFTVFNDLSSYTASTSAFLLGLIWQDKESFFVQIIRKKWCVLSTGVAFIFLFLGRLVIMKYGITNLAIQCLLRNMISCLFVIWIMALLQKGTIKSKILTSLGKQSYELYLVHATLLPVIGKVGLFPYFLMSLSGAYLLHWILVKIKRTAGI